MKCSKCLDNFPDDLVQPMAVGTPEGLKYLDLCGVCALEKMRQVHGNPTLMFNGPMAKDIYHRSKAHKEKLAQARKAARK